MRGSNAADKNVLWNYSFHFSTLGRAEIGFAFHAASFGELRGGARSYMALQGC